MGPMRRRWETIMRDDGGEHHAKGEPGEWQTFAAPAPVFDANGEQVGVLSLVNPGDYLVILPVGGGTYLYVPLSAVNRSDESGIYLALTRADLRDDAWRRPPKPR
jgi:hypothetical protein